MGHDSRRLERIARISPSGSPVDSDYANVAAAVADAAQWDVLELGPGAFTLGVGSLVLPALKRIVGSGRDQTILTTLSFGPGVTIWDATAGGVVFEDLTLRGGNGTTSCRLINGSGQRTRLRNVRVQYQGTHETQIVGDVTTDEHCLFELYSKTGSFQPTGTDPLDVASYIAGTIRENGIAGAYSIVVGAGILNNTLLHDLIWELWGAATGLIFTDPTGSAYVAMNNVSGGVGGFVACKFGAAGGWSNVVIEGCALGSGPVEATTNDVVIHIRGTQGESLVLVDSSPGGATWDVDDGPTVRVVATPATIPAYAGRVEVDVAAAAVVTLPLITKRPGGQPLPICDASGLAHRNPITVQRNAAPDTIRDAAATSYVIDWAWAEVSCTSDFTDRRWQVSGEVLPERFETAEFVGIPNDTENRYYRTPPYPCTLKAVYAEAHVPASSAGTYLLDVLNGAVSLLNAAFDLKGLVADTQASVPLTGTAADRDLPASTLLRIPAVSNNGDLVAPVAQRVTLVVVRR